MQRLPGLGSWAAVELGRCRWGIQVEFCGRAVPLSPPTTSLPSPQPPSFWGPSLPFKYLDLLKTIGGKWSIQKLCIKVINANSSEEIASTDGNGTFATNAAAGCADGNYGMYVTCKLWQAEQTALLNSAGIEASSGFIIACLTASRPRVSEKSRGA